MYVLTRNKYRSAYPGYTMSAKCTKFNTQTVRHSTHSKQHHQSIMTLTHYRPEDGDDGNKGGGDMGKEL